MVAPQVERELILQDGLWLDAETGEIIRADDETFEVTDVASAEWVLERKMEAEANAARAQIMLNAVKERLEAERNRHLRKAEWLETRYGPGIVRVAEQELEGKKERTFNFTFGAVSFRKTKGGVKVVDEERAITWAKSAAPEAVKTTEKFLVSKLPAKATAGLSEDALAANGLRIEEPGETVSIKTGVKP